MNKVCAAVLIVALGLTGCKSKSEEGGRAGNATFRIVVPALATDVKQGELQTVRVSVERGEGFKQQVKLDAKAPAGIQVDPSRATVEAGDKGDVQLKVTAAKDAPIGEHKILLKGTPEKGEPTETELRITVSAR